MFDGLKSTRRRTAASRGCRSTTTWGSSASSSRRIFALVQVMFLPTMAFVRRPSLWLEAIHRVRGTITFAPNFAYALATKRSQARAAREVGPLVREGLRLRRRAHQPGHDAHVRRDPLEGEAEPQRAAALLRHGRGDARHQLHRHGRDALDRRHRLRRVPEAAHRRACAPLEAGPKAKRKRSSTAARPSPVTRSASSTTKGKRLAERRIGEIQVRGPSVAKGYFRDPDATERTFGGGWLKTGDLGYLANGNVYIVGRKKDIIIINGRNYDPQRLEWLVDDMAGVRKGSSVAFSKPGAASEELIIVLEARTNSATELEALKESVKQRIVEQMQLTPTDVVVCPVGSLAQDLERQAAALEDAPAVPRRHRRQRGQPHHRLQRREGRAGPPRRALAARPFPSPCAPRRRARPRGALGR
jgi:fatty-acyl-CoA synthase